MDRLIHNVAVILKLREQTLINKCTPSSPGDSLGATANAPFAAGSATAAEPPPVACHSKELFDIVVAVESLITHLVFVLSDGLWAGLDLWTVFVALERSPPQSSSNKSRPANLQQYHKVGSGMIHLIKSSFSTIPDPVKTRAFLRLALNQSCLLLVLEILAREFSAIVESYMMEHAILAQYGSDKWDRFVAAIAPISGPPLDVFTSSSSSTTSSQPAAATVSSRSSDDGASTSRLFMLGGKEVRGVASFDLDLIVPEFDFRPSYMNKLKMYISSQLPERECPPLPIELVPPHEEAEKERRAESVSSQASKRTGVVRVPADTADDREQLTGAASQSTATEPLPIITVDEAPSQPPVDDAAASPSRPTKRIVKKVVVVKRVVKKSSNGSTTVSISSSSFAGASTSTEGDTTNTSFCADVPVQETGTDASRDDAAASSVPAAVAACDAPDFQRSSPTVPSEDARDTSNSLSVATSKKIQEGPSSSVPSTPSRHEEAVVVAPPASVPSPPHNDVVAERNPLIDEALNHLAALVEARRQYLQERIDSLRLQLDGSSEH